MPDPTTGSPTSSQSDTQQSQAGSGVGGAGVGVNAQQAAAQTGAAQAGAGAAGQAAQEEIVSDVGQGQAYLINMKRLVENALTVDAQLNQILVGSAQRLAKNSEDFDGQLRQLAIQALANNNSLANRVNNQAISDDVRANDNAATADKALDAEMIAERERTTRGGDAGDVLRWQAVATMDTITDTIVAKVLARMAAQGKA